MHSNYLKIIVAMALAVVIFIGGLLRHQATQNSRTQPNTQTLASQQAEGNLEEASKEAMGDQIQMVQGGTDSSGESMEEDSVNSETESAPSLEPTQDLPGQYADYDPAALAQAHARGDKVVLFFYAPWCPYCRAADSEFLGNLGNLPAGVTLLKTSYDRESELKQKYTVTYQHTFVQIDAAGNMIAKWNGGALDALISNLK